MTRALRSTRAARLLTASVLLAASAVYAAPQAQAQARVVQSQAQLQATSVVSVVTGQDIGWPMCPKERGGQGKPMPPDFEVGFVIPELNSGLAFVQNQCLGDHYQWARDRSSLLGGYLFPNFPDAQMRTSAATGRFGACTTSVCVLKNSGYAQAEWDVAQLAAAGVSLPMIWVDIEHQPRLGGTRMWTRNVLDNRAVLTGVFTYLKEHHIRIGVYSYPNGYREIVGDWPLTYPEWIPTGTHLASDRLARCAKPGFSNGPVWMTQSTRLITDYDIDDDTICPAAARAIPLMFSSPTTSTPMVPDVRDWRLTRHAATVLRYRDRGAAVMAAQGALGISADGVYGLGTSAAVLKFQREQGWRGSGVIGPRTWIALGA